MSELLYDSPFESQFIIVLDQSKRVLGYSDAWPGRQYRLKLPKGQLTARLQVRHHDKAALERLVGLPLTVTRKLKKPVPVKVFPSRSAAATDGSACAAKAMVRGQHRVVFLAAPDLDVAALPEGYAESKVGGKIASGATAPTHALRGAFA